nr:MobA/MobL family protein [Sphingomonas hankookensis]
MDAAAADLPAAFVAHCRAEQKRWAASRKRPKSFKPKRYRADEPACAAILDVLRQAPGWPDEDPPVIFTPGSAGRTQYRYVAELPHELGADDRAAIVRDFCNHLGSFARDAEGRPTGMMYTAVIHAPGPGNDRRNFHLHVIAHDRPAKWMPDPGKWDFEIAEEFKRKGETRVRYPHRQEKIIEVSRSLAPDKRPDHYNAAIAGKAFVPHLRERFAGICNDRLALRGIQRRIDARSHEALGIDKTPELHLGTRAAALERAGVPTVIGRYNAAASWQYAALAERCRTESYFGTWQQQDDALAKSVVGSPEGVALMGERRAVLHALEETRDLAWENDRLRDQARSRAKATLDHCVMSLAQVSGSAAHRKAVEKRKQEAEEHLARVEAAIAAG